MNRENFEWEKLDKKLIQKFLNELKDEYAPKPKGGYTLYHLKDYCEKRLQPTSLDEAFVNVYKLEPRTITSEQQFMVGHTTPRLIELHKFGGPLHLDGSYGTNHFGFPYLMVGVSDADCVFHPTTMATCRGETIDDYVEVLQGVVGGYE